jgi:hypothetical protein
MAQSFKIEQASIVPSIFIGLGGTGSRIVDRIATRAAGLPHWESHLRPLTQFVCLDTNQKDLGELTRIPPTNRILISAFDKQRAVINYRESNNMKALHWLDRAYTPRPGVTPGAGQIRVESRLGFHFNSPSIREKLDELIRITLKADNPFRQTSPAEYFVYIYCGLGGGTGSGSFLPMSYLVQSIVRGLQWQPRVLGYLVLSTLMVKKVAPDLHQDIHANTYAALKELEYLTKLDYPETQVEKPQGEPFVYWNDEQDPNIPTVKTRPFYLSLIIDRADHLELPELEPLVGDASFLQVFSPILGRVAGEVDNYDKHLQELTTTPGKLRGVGRGYTKHFGAFGVAALVLPAFELLEYSALRFAAESLRQQITFGSSEASSAIDARLADLRVNYDDPKFARLSEGERQVAINKSFVLSMQAMAEEDQKDGLLEGVWYKLVEDVDTGKVTGRDEQGKEQRTETLLVRVLRLLDQERAPILADIAIPAPNLLPVQPESLGNYNDILNKFEAAVATSNRKVEEGKERLRSSAKQGDVIERLNPKPSPLQERYLVIRLFEKLDSTLIPEAEKKLTGASAKSYSNAKIQEKFRQENPSLLSDAANAKKLVFMKDREAFQTVRDGVQTDFQQTGGAQKNYYDSDLRLAQYRSLRDYIEGRARQYANLATRMNDVVGDLDRDAERIRHGLSVDQPRFALSVEVFETMDDPKRRLWREVFDELFVKGGRGQTTFDRQVLATTIAEQLRPVQDKSTGKYVPKQDYQLEADLKTALTALGRDRLRTAIYGGPNESGLNIETGIQLEARICLRSSSDMIVREDEIERYTERKLRAFALMSGVYGRLSRVDSETLDDGVKMARTRNLVIQDSVLTPGFVDKLRNFLLRDGRPPQIAGWNPVPDQHIALAHDMDLPIPLYYFIPVVGEIEANYEKVAAIPRRTYNLHIDYHWEQTLPNLNPSKDKLNTSWALNTLLEGMLYRVIRQTDAGWTWVDADQVLGTNLSSSLYRLGEYHRAVRDTLQKRLDESLRTAAAGVTPEELLARSEKLLAYIKQTMLDIALAAQKGNKTREDGLEEPIWTMFEDQLESKMRASRTASQESPGTAARSVRRLDL